MVVLSVQHLKKYFPVHQGILLRPKRWIAAVDDVSFDVEKGQTLGIVGESGCGKTTLGRCIMGLYPLTSGRVMIHSKSVSNLDRQQRKALGLKIQMIFQDPFDSLDPRQTIEQILMEKFLIHNYKKADARKEISLLLERVGLSEDSLGKFPHEFSGGQRQRVGIARAISLNPDIIICDEPVSALDVSVQSKILNLLLDLQQQSGLTYVVISHDLSVIKHVSDSIAVMYLGSIVETAPTLSLYNSPRHPYTRALLSAIPDPDPANKKKRIILQGEVPSVENPPSGCRFHTRCPHAADICRMEIPELSLKDEANQHFSSCHFDGMLL